MTIEMKTMMMLVSCVCHDGLHGPGADTGRRPGVVDVGARDLIDQTILDECNRDAAAVCGGTVPNRRIFGCQDRNGPYRTPAACNDGVAPGTAGPDMLGHARACDVASSVVQRCNGVWHCGRVSPQ
jgi:hypothetical protein